MINVTLHFHNETEVMELVNALDWVCWNIADLRFRITPSKLERLMIGYFYQKYIDQLEDGLIDELQNVTHIVYVNYYDNFRCQQISERFCKTEAEVENARREYQYMGFDDDEIQVVSRCRECDSDTDDDIDRLDNNNEQNKHNKNDNADKNDNDNNNERKCD